MTPLPKSVVHSLQFPAFTGPEQTQQLALQFQLQNTQWWTAEEIKRHQFNQLNVVLRHAVQTVPYYTELFRKKAINLPEFIDEVFIASLPISSRADLQAAGTRLFSTRLPAEHGNHSPAKTSGSTGQPLTFGRTAATQAIWLACALRDHLWHERDFTGKLCAIRWAAPGVSEAPNGSCYPDWGRTAASIFQTGPASILSVIAKLSEQYAWLIQQKPDYLMSFPSNLIALTDYARKNNLSLPKLKEIRTFGEMLTPENRSSIETGWETKVVDLYSCEESGFLALQCPKNNHYHVQSESVLIEILNERNQPCAPGQMGRVVITNLNNFSTPLIRYEIGDYATVGAPCNCGRGLPVIMNIHGRQRNRLILPDGQSLFPRVGERSLNECLPGVMISKLKCIQNSTHEVELLLVVDRELSPGECQKVKDQLCKNLGHPFEIKLSFPSDIPLGPSGKFEMFESRVQP